MDLTRLEQILDRASSRRITVIGDLMLDELISRHITLDEINEGFAALKRGETIRSVITFD